MSVFPLKNPEFIVLIWLLEMDKNCKLRSPEMASGGVCSELTCNLKSESIVLSAKLWGWIVWIWL